MAKDILKGERVCLRCKHLYCENPFLIDATELHFDGIKELRRKHGFK